MKSSLHSLIPFLPFLLTHLRLPTLSIPTTDSLSEAESESLNDWRLTVNQFILATTPWDSWPPFFFQLNTCSHSLYITFSLTRGWVGRLQLLLALSSAVILRFESRGTHDHILLAQIRDSPNMEDQVPVFITPRNKVARLYPQALVSLSIASYDLQGFGGRYTDLGRPPQKTPFYNNSSIVIGVCLPCHCIGTEVIRLLLGYLLPQECVYRTVT
jgi:hypothetical protein